VLLLRAQLSGDSCYSAFADFGTRKFYATTDMLADMKFLVSQFGDYEIAGTWNLGSLKN
jgi:hypothetical protein